MPRWSLGYHVNNGLSPASMTIVGGEKRPPSSPLESVDYKRRMEVGTGDLKGAEGTNTAGNKEIITGIKDLLPGMMSEVFDANMAAMEERLTTQINNMTKRLEDKIEASNVSYNERLENMETVQD